jgi:hypothetical protein
MKEKTKGKLLAVAGLPLALNITVLSAAALGGCRQAVPLEYVLPEKPAFSSIFDYDGNGIAADEVGMRIAAAYDAIWQSNPQLINALTFRGFKKLPIRIYYDPTGPCDTMEYSRSSHAIRIEGSFVDASFAELLEKALEAYLNDLQTHRWEKITHLSNKTYYASKQRVRA